VPAIDIEIVHGDEIFLRFEVVHTCSNQISGSSSQNQLAIEGCGEMLIWSAAIQNGDNSREVAAFAAAANSSLILLVTSMQLATAVQTTSKV
jgi:hypothetical protein